MGIGTVINDKWVILEFIAKGGMGEVYRAHQLNLKRDVAIKIISKEWLETLVDDEEQKQSGLERFRNEVQAMAQAQHPNILQIFDHGTFSPPSNDVEGPLEYIVMEYVPGSTLRSTMSDEGFYPEEDLTRDWINKYFMPVLDGVEALHDLGIIHRDLKPENVLIDKHIPKIADFGLAHSVNLKPVTHSADMKGTPAYMSPEQFLDFRRTDERTDIYALGKMLYEAIEGRIQPNSLPFKQASLKKAESLIFEKLDQVIKKATAEEKTDRISSIDELRKMLQDALTPRKSGEYGLSVGTGGGRKGRPLASVLAERKRLIALIVGALFLVLLSIWALSMVEFGSTGPSHLEIGAPKIKASSSAVSSKKVPGSKRSTDQLPRTINMEDGATLHLIIGGDFEVPDALSSASDRKISVSTYYMDETLVTNQQYVDFLNQVLSRVKVEQNVVRGDGRIWLLLGEALQGYEPIVYQQGRFHINKPAHASCPVIRVTAYGAEAYAKFYGRRLPTAIEWVYALLRGGEVTSLPNPPTQPQREDWEWSPSSSMMDMMHGPPQVSSPSLSQSAEPPQFPSPVLNSKPNSLGIRGLNGNISEWGIMRSPIFTRHEKAEYVVLGGLGGGKQDTSPVPAPLARKPWEAFEEVGFRTVLDPQ